MLVADTPVPESSPSGGNRRGSAQLVRPRAAAILLLAEPTVSRRLPVVGRLARCTRGELLSHKYSYRLLVLGVGLTSLQRQGRIFQKTDEAPNRGSFRKKAAYQSISQRLAVRHGNFEISQKFQEQSAIENSWKILKFKLSI